jgi:uncharacterized protein (TIGR03435 family)
MFVVLRFLQYHGVTQLLGKPVPVNTSKNRQSWGKVKSMTLQRCLAAALIIAGCSLRIAAQQPAPAFEVASIRPHTAPLHTIRGLNISGPRVTMEGYTIPLLIEEAYNLRGAWQMSLPAFPGRHELLSVYYDVLARAPGDHALTREDFRRMLQTLLADRFKLTVHRETKDLPVYALIVGKSGPKLKDSAIEGECSLHVGVVTGGQSYSFSNCTIGKLADMLGSGLVDRPVVDKTRLTGTYDFRLVTMPAFLNQNRADAVEASPFTALHDLGLKLESQKSAVEIVAVDHFDQPGEN